MGGGRSIDARRYPVAITLLTPEGSRRETARSLKRSRFRREPKPQDKLLVGPRNASGKKPVRRYGRRPDDAVALDALIAGAIERR